jgi:hypothetical protein
MALASRREARRLLVAIRLATSSRNGLTSLLKISNGGTEPGHVLIVAFGEAWPFQLLLAELGQRMQTATEQRPHLLRCHPIPCGKTLDPSHPGANPPPGSRRVRCSTTPTRCGPSPSSPKQPPAGSSSHTPTPLVWMLMVTPPEVD